MGVLLTVASYFTGSLNWFVRNFTKVETDMNSVERVLHYNETASGTYINNTTTSKCYHLILFIYFVIFIIIIIIFFFFFFFFKWFFKSNSKAKL